MFFNKNKILGYRYCKQCGREFLYKKEEIQFDRYLGIVTKFRFIRRCPKFSNYMGISNGHDYWSWTEKADDTN